jgi:hypothetical protein
LPLLGSVADMNRPRAVVIDGDVLEVISSTAIRSEVRPATGVDVHDEVVTRAIAALGKQPYHRALEALLHKGHRDHWAGIRNAGRFDFEGGADFASFVTGKPKRKCRHLTGAYEDAARALLLTFPNPHDAEHWVSLAGGGVRPGRGSRPGKISLALTSEAMPTYVHTLPRDGLREREARRLVPFTAPSVTLKEGNRVKGPQLWFWARLVARLRERAAEVYTHKGARLTWPALEKIAEVCGLAAKWVRPLVKLWLDSGDLVSPSTGRYHLGERHADARASIDVYGKREADGRIGIPPPEKRRKRTTAKR